MTENTAADRQGTNPLADLVGLTDEELCTMGAEIADVVTDAPADAAALRHLVAEWALTVRLRSHPDFATNAAAFTSVMADRGFVTASS